MNIVERYNIWQNRFDRPENVWKHIIELSYSISREMSPIFTIGTPQERSFSRGHRGIAGTFSLLVNNKKDLKDMIETIEKHGIQFNPRVQDSSHRFGELASNKIYSFEGVEILNESDSGLSLEDKWSNICTFTFVAKDMHTQELP